MKKGFFKKTGALMLAATLTVSMVRQQKQSPCQIRSS